MLLQAVPLSSMPVIDGVVYEVAVLVFFSALVWWHGVMTKLYLVVAQSLFLLT